LIKRKQILFGVLALATTTFATANTEEPTETQQQPQPIVVHNANSFFAVEGSFSINSTIISNETLQNTSEEYLAVNTAKIPVAEQVLQKIIKQQAYTNAAKKTTHKTKRDTQPKETTHKPQPTVYQNPWEQLPNHNSLSLTSHNTLAVGAGTTHSKQKPTQKHSCFAQSNLLQQLYNRMANQLPQHTVPTIYSTNEICQSQKPLNYKTFSRPPTFFG